MDRYSEGNAKSMVSTRYIVLLVAFVTSVVVSPLSAQTRMAELPLGTSLRAHLRIEKRCMFGDFDVLKLDMQYSHKAKVKLSLIFADGSREYSQEVFSSFSSGASGTDVTKAIVTLLADGERASVPLPKSMKDGVYALVLCKVSPGKQGCAEIPVVDLNVVLDKYKQPLGDYEVPEDHVYFYQPVVVSSGKIQALRKTVTPETIDEASAALTEVVKVPDENVRAVLQKASIVMSNPLELFSNELVLNVPMYSKKKCEG